MVRMFASCAGHDRACRLRDCRHRLRQSRCAGACGGARGAAGAEAAIWHLRLRHGGHGPQRRPGRRFLSNLPTAPGPRTRRFPADKSRLRHVQRARRSVAGSGRGRSSKSRRRIRTARSATPIASFMDEARDRGEGPDAVRAVAERDPRHQVEDGSRRRFMPTPTGSASASPSAMFVGQDRKAPTNMR